MADQHVKPWDGRNGQYVYCAPTLAPTPPVGSG